MPKKQPQPQPQPASDGAPRKGAGDALEQQVTAVFLAWQQRRPNPSLVKLTPPRAAAIRARLRDGHTAEQLALLVGEYAHTACTREALWWRGESPESDGTQYLDIINLLRVQKTAGRVERAWAWKHGQAEERGRQRQQQQDETDAQVPDVNLGPMGVFRNPGWPANGQPHGRVRGKIPRR